MIALHHDNSLNTEWLKEPLAFAQSLAQSLGKEFRQLDFALSDTDDICSNHAVDMLIFTCQNSNRDIQHILDACRNLRIPYIIITPDMEVKTINKDDVVLIPVSMFEEELSKAEIATALGRFCKSHTILIQANDYGTRAEKNIGKIRTLIEKFDLPYDIIKGHKNSYKVEMETATMLQPQYHNSKLIVISASRDYGIDDLLFGPKERHIIRKAAIPVLLLNPRGDLYSLCD